MIHVETARYGYLRKNGHGVTLFDSHYGPPGKTRYGIPRYRPPEDVLNREILEDHFQPGILMKIAELAAKLCAKKTARTIRFRRITRADE